MEENINVREEVSRHSENTWVIFLGTRYTNHQLSPLVDTVDWYNNQLLTKSILNKQVDLSFGAKTLMATTGLLKSERLLILGVGDGKEAGPAQARKLLQDLGQTLTDLGESNPWIIIADDVSEKFVDEVKKSRTSIAKLSQATISVG